MFGGYVSSLEGNHLIKKKPPKAHPGMLTQECFRSSERIFKKTCKVNQQAMLPGGPKPGESATRIYALRSLSFPDAPCMEYLPTLA